MIPEYPITRVEQYLDEIVKNGGSSVEVEALSVTENGTYTAEEGKAYSPVSVAVENSYVAADEGKVVSNGALVAQTSDSVTENGTVDTTLINSLTVNVPQGGGGGDLAEEKDVNFIDYDGTLLYSYTAADFANLTELPANPSHDGLTAQGWNWTLADAKDYVASNGFLWIGQEYVTDDGSTRIEIELRDGRTSPCLTFALNGTATIDWGDSSPAESVSGSSTTTAIVTPHTYTKAGKYTIAINVTGGTLYIIVPSGTGSVFFNGNGVADDYYKRCVRYIYIGSNTLVNSNYGLTGFTFAGIMPANNITGAVDDAYKTAQRATALILPHTWAFNDSSADTIFSGWASARRLSLPNTSGAKAIVASCFSSWGTLESLSIPPVRYIRSSAFDYCYSLKKLVIPSSVNEIQGNAFRSSALKEIHFKKSTPPTLNSTSFANLPTDCKIYVPTGKLSAYTSASNYPSSSTYTYIEE